MIDADGNFSVNIMDEFDLATFERYSEALKNAMLPTGQFTRTLVERNFNSYGDHEKFAATLIGLGRQFGTPNSQALGEALMSQIMNWLMSFRLYLDYAETDLKHRFGKTSEQVRRFKDRSAEAFDQHVGYRFIYKFRNYVQHCGAPLSSISIVLPTETPANPFIKQRTQFLLNRDELLASYGEWGRVRPDLAAMDETFYLRPLAEEAMDQLRAIDRLLLEIALAEGARTITDLREALSLLPAEVGGLPALFRFTVMESGLITTVSPTPISVNAIERYERVASGEIRVSDLFVAAQPPRTPSIFDPATVRERFRRDNRAVQAMSLFLEEGGGTPAFQAGVNQMVQHDQTVEPLITGFVNMSAVLLHMTAAVLGVESRGLLGRLLDIYAAESEDENPEGGNL